MKTDIGTGRLLLFRAGERLYGCDIAIVREIVPVRHATRLPGAPDSVLGLINLRGTVLTVLDLAARLDGRPGEAPPADGSIIVMEHGSKAVGVAVTEVMDVQRIAEDDVRAAADAESVIAGHDADIARVIVRGVARLGDGRVVILLDMHCIVGQLLL
ncbi:MAG: chemotaxis protein CheW [Gemmatimonadaceae bacterium]